jgi:FMN reductase
MEATMKKRLVLLGGSMRTASYSLAALRAAAALAEGEGAETTILSVRELDLPMFRPNTPIVDYPAEQQPGIHALIEGYRSADAMIWSSPTYHGTISGVVKNALDFAELLRGDARPYLQGVPIGLLVVSDPTTFGAMINSAHELRAWPAPTRIALRKEHFDAEFSLIDERSQTRLLRQIRELVNF